MTSPDASVNPRTGRCVLIGRLWRGLVPAHRAEEYRAYQLEVGPPGYRRIPGNRAAYALGRELGELYEVAMLSLWESWEAVRAFAGDPPDAARYYERDLDFLVHPPERVEHFAAREAARLGGGPEAPRLARLWRSRVDPQRAAEARRRELELGVPAYVRSPGNLGVLFLERLDAPPEEVGFLTLWSSLDAVRGFAGDPPERARYDAGRAAGHLVDPPERAEHFAVLAAAREEER